MPETIRSHMRARALRVLREHQQETVADCSCGFVGDLAEHLATLLTDAMVTDWDAIRGEVSR